MKVAAANAIASLAREFVPDEGGRDGERPNYGKNILFHLLLTQG